MFELIFLYLFQSKCYFRQCSIAEQDEITILPAQTKRLGPRKGNYGYVPEVRIVVGYEFESF